MLLNRMPFRSIVAAASVLLCAGCAAQQKTVLSRLPSPIAATNSACVSDFERLAAVTSADYPGFAETKRSRGIELDALTNTISRDALTASSDSTCTASLRHWTAFFSDHHFQIGATTPAAPAPSAASTSPARASPARALAIVYPNDSTAVITIPSFGQRWKTAIDSMLTVHRHRLLKTPFLVIDLRGNGGGWTGSYRELIPLIYTNPIKVHGMDMWASQGNIDATRQRLATPGINPQMREQIEQVVVKMEAGRGGFVTMADDQIVQLDTVFRLPRRVAVVIDRGCVSTCEQFLLDARQSTKVTIIGRVNTGGFLDYGNIRQFDLPSGARRVFMPTSRSRRLPAQPMDAVGIPPQVHVPETAADPLTFAIEYVARQGG